jgi:hypothetical protein
MAPVWFESVNPTTRTRNGHLVEPQGARAWAVSTYAETGTGFATALRVFTLRRDESGVVRVEVSPEKTEKATDIRGVAEVVMATVSGGENPHTNGVYWVSHDYGDLCAASW